MREMMMEESRKRKVVAWGVNFLSWMSPFIGFGIFFPIGVLFAFPHDRDIRRNAFSSIVLQIGISAVLIPLELLQIYSTTAEQIITLLILLNPEESKLSGALVLVGFFFTGIVLLFLQSKFVRNRLKKREPEPPILKPVLIFIAIFFLLVLTSYLTYSMDKLRTKMAPFLVFSESLWVFFPWLVAISGMMSGGRPFFLFRRPWAWFSKQVRVGRASETGDSPDAFQKRKYAKIRDAILPGWGHIYCGNLWRGFPILFVYLLLLLFFSTFLFSWIEPAFGIRFLAAIGLKPGIPDKTFFEATSSFFPWAIALVLLLSTYVFSGWLLRRSFRTPIPSRGLRPGFANNLALSFLFHLILFSLFLIIPTMMVRQKDQSMDSRPDNHYVPENHAEFYFIDPNIPDEVKGLNGSVVTGTDTPSTQQGEKIPKEKPGDEGRVKGDVKKIKGKKLPPTYSNYISAKMRTYESFMDYWKSAPPNYSCVVAYTITPDGDVVDVELVQHSQYPEQDRRTLELIENLSPMMPPPGTKGYIRVTELFWNGAINPDAMPTDLQRDLVTMFDGRYMEEL